jgi:hypothetical protein
MLKRTPIIATILVLALSSAACESATPQRARDGSAHANSTSSDPERRSNTYEDPVPLAQLEDRGIKESSGIVASRRNPDVFWTHNDSGDGPIIYAFDRRGKSEGRWRVANAEAIDWEDIAAGPGPQSGISYLYLGDIGDNDLERNYVTVYRVVEPAIQAGEAPSTTIREYVTEPAEAIRLKYPDGRHNAEALMVHPATGDLYIVTKSLEAPAAVYKLKAPYSTASMNTLVRVKEISLRSFIGGVITGGDISPDGRRVIMCDYLGAGELVLPDGFKGEFDEIWNQPMATVDISPRKQGEAVCYRLDGLAVLATSEKRPTPLIEAKRR